MFSRNLLKNIYKNVVTNRNVITIKLTKTKINAEICIKQIWIWIQKIIKRIYIYIYLSENRSLVIDNLMNVVIMLLNWNGFET